MTKAEAKFWRSEMAMLDKLYRARMEGWQRLVDAYDLKFKDKIRDLKKTEYVKISEFLPLLRQLVATVAMNYPKLFFQVLDDEGEDGGTEEILERATSALFEITKAKNHVHQAIVDVAFCGVAWIRTDFNPVGADIIAPWTANDEMEEDLVSFSRCPPGYVHLDPMCPPHMLGHARYIREKLWIPLKSLKDDDSIKNKNQLKPTSVGASDYDSLGFGEPTMDRSATEELTAMREAVENGEFVLCDRIHDRMNRKLIMFAPGVEEAICEKPHPFMKRVFPQRIDFLGQPMFDPETADPMLDLESKGADGEPGQPGVGWLVQHGFSFTCLRFDMHPTGFYPRPMFEYVEDLQNVIVESMSRKAALMKRWSRQGLVNQAEIDANTKGIEVIDAIRRGEDGEWHAVADINNFGKLEIPEIPQAQSDLEDRARVYIERITQTNELKRQPQADPLTATEAALIGAAASVNAEWLEACVSGAYVGLARNGLTVMGDPRYTPENFRVNVAPDGEKRLSRALQSADFLWNYRISVQAGSMQPLFEQMQQERLLGFYDRAVQSPNFDRRELDKMLAAASDIGDPEKLMVSDTNPEAMRAAQLENDRMISQMQDPGVLPEQDHKAHAQIHQQYRAHPTYQQLMRAAQTMTADGQPGNPASAQMAQMIDAIMQNHMQAHAQAEQQQQQGATGQGRQAAPGADSLINQVRANAQYTSQSASRERVL